MAQCISLACGLSLFKPTGFYNLNGEKDAWRKTRKLPAYIRVAPYQPYIKLQNHRLKKVDSVGKWKDKLGNVKCVVPISVMANSVDWRSNGSNGGGAVAAIKDKGSCEQHLVDCDTSCYQGCNGGDRVHAFAFVDENDGIHKDMDNPYTGKDEKCNTSRNETKVITRIEGYQSHVPANNELQKAIFSGKCGTDLDHNVVVVGNENEACQDYPLVRNSWRAGSREEDYQKMEHHVEEKTDKCETTILEASFPIQNPTASPSHPTRVMPQHQHQQMSKPALEPHVSRKQITILSIDGGGVRGITASVILAHLETELQRLHGEDARLAQFFDLITGASTGGLITVMLTTPNEEGHPKFTAKNVTDFYLEHASKIFPYARNAPFDPVLKGLKNLWQPKHDGEYLRKILKDELHETLLNETVTNVFIPAFDMKTGLPVYFSSYQLKNDPSLNVKLSDICLGTSAAPTYFPLHSFHVNDTEGNLLREFNLVDGGVVANNPTELAIHEATCGLSMNGCRVIVVSVGTGFQDFQEKYKDINLLDWGRFKWLMHRGSSPLVDVVSSSSNYKTENSVAKLMQLFGSTETYLRIQDYALSGDIAPMDLATDENLKKLVKAGTELLKKPVTRMNPVTCKLELLPHVTNEMELKRIAKLLHEERKSRTESCLRRNGLR